MPTDNEFTKILDYCPGTHRDLQAVVPEVWSEAEEGDRGTDPERQQSLWFGAENKKEPLDEFFRTELSRNNGK